MHSPKEDSLLMVQSKALEINLADYHVDVSIDSKYLILQQVMSRYYGLMDGINAFLKELSHPYRNWAFIVSEARGFSLDYFHLLRTHPVGEEAASLFIDILMGAVESSPEMDVRENAADTLLVYIQKIIRESGPEFKRFYPAVNFAFQRITDLNDDLFFLFVKSFYQIRKFGDLLLKYAPDSQDEFGSLTLLLSRAYAIAYAYWLNEADPKIWFEKEILEEQKIITISDIFRNISHERIYFWKAELDAIIKNCAPGSRDLLSALTSLSGFAQIVQEYRNIPNRLLESGKTTGQGNRWKVIFLFHIMGINGLSALHEEALREINQTISWLIEHEKGWNIEKLLNQAFIILKNSINKFPSAALNGILNMGKGVYNTEKADLVQMFINAVIDLGFQTPKITGVGNDWQIKVNSAHLLNIRTWLELIEQNPKQSVNLLSCLVIYLSVCGVFIKDTDLFPRDITRFLNSDISPVYNLAKQLARLFPAYFNDIGAEGKLRDISTTIDEITHRKDVLIHFLRKQSHVESSNQIVDFMEATFDFWKTGDKDLIKSFVPPGIFEQIQSDGLYFDGPCRIMNHLDSKGIQSPKALLRITEEELRNLIHEVEGISDKDRERVALAGSFYKTLHQKYTLDPFSLEEYLNQINSDLFPDISRLKGALAEKNLKKKLFRILDYLELLKSFILSGKSYEVKEDIYKKRHITVDIPSTYGSYHEMKFDALGLSFRLESFVNVLFETLIAEFDFSLITKATFFQIFDLLILFDKALKLDGISSLEIERQLDLISHSLEVKGFTFTQYLDIFKGLSQAVSNVIHDYFNNIHEPNMVKILSRLEPDQVLSKYIPQDASSPIDSIKHRISEIFFRDRIALSLGLQQFDVFVSRILRTLFHQADQLPKEKLHQLLLYDPERAMMSISQAKSKISGVIYLGSKGFNLIKLHNFGFPVPPGFIITTEVFRFKEAIKGFPQAEQNLTDQVCHHIAHLEKTTGKVFGEAKNPLLFSVRSGASISQPGMMDTFLNVGMNESIAEGLSEKNRNPWFAWDNYRRYLQCYGMSFGIERDEFDAVINRFKQELGIPLKRDFSGEQMRRVALAYKEMIRDCAIPIEEDPFRQLMITIERVFVSWDSSKAKAYRKILGISDDWGTAVTIQSMVFGNRSRKSGSGVIFTHNPRWSGDALRLWGDFTLGNQGEDVAMGLVTTLPISINQQEIEMRDTDVTLESHFPEIYNRLYHWSNDLIYKKGWGPQEIEFTFESPSAEDLYLLQARDMVIRERKAVFTFDYSQVDKARYLGHGIGAGGGALSGRAVFSLKEIDKWRKKEPDTALILIRSDTVPDDIREIHAADGLLTARGGVTSHAAVVAHRMSKTCVVGCDTLVCREKEKSCEFDKTVIHSGDFISIDGHEGSVYIGYIDANPG
ncbi:MAG: PEP/pyruvate-binding domain-containing protein [Thermodesulfobacteriota bacterium]